MEQETKPQAIISHREAVSWYKIKPKQKEEERELRWLMANSNFLFIEVV